MSLDIAQLKRVLLIYESAWVNQDPDLILEIFTEDATYLESTYQQPFRGHNEIRSYWINKVLKGQKNIQFKLLNIFIDNNVAIAEWVAEFDDIAYSTRKEITEVAILTFKENKIHQLREYWHSRRIDSIQIEKS